MNPIVEVNFEDNKLSAYQDDYVKGYRHGGRDLKLQTKKHENAKKG